MQTQQYSAQDEMALMASLWAPELRDNPLAFVRFAFPWGQKGTPLENFKGPRKWQTEVLQSLADHIAANANKTPSATTSDIPYDTLRQAVASGRGIGKSALVSWLVIWMLSTRLGSTTIVSANSEAQLRAVTWAEITKWLSLALNSHWFEVSATRVAPAKWLAERVEDELKIGTRYWSAEGRLWSEENPDSYAGVHNFAGVMLVFDEASGIPDTIWQVAAGFFTENTPNRFWLAFSNPRRNSGYFYECFNSNREFWDTRHIDARDVEGTDKSVYQSIIEEYGADSIPANVEIYGQFPDASDDQFIGAGLVDGAASRRPYKDMSAPVVIGVDPARFGADATVIAVRRGRDLVEVQRHRGDDTMASVGKIIAAMQEYKPALVIIDEGGLGAGVVDRLKEQRYRVRGVNFASTPRNKTMWANKRAEMWGDMRDWLRTASIPRDRYLKADLISPAMKQNSQGAVLLESKKDMKARGLASPDAADALALTFAYQVASASSVGTYGSMPASRVRIARDVDYRVLG